MESRVASRMTQPATPSTIAKTTRNSSAERNAIPERMLARRMHRIAAVARGVDQRHLEGLVNFRAEPAHVGFDDGGLGIEIEVPDPLEQHGLGDDAAGIAHEDLEQG